MSPRRDTLPTHSANLLETLLAAPQNEPGSTNGPGSTSDSLVLDQTIDIVPPTVNLQLGDLLAGDLLSGWGGEGTAKQPAVNLESRAQATLEELPQRHLITPGSPVDGRADYRLIGPLGSGGTGIVFQAHQRAINREVAIKVLRDHLRGDLQSRQRFLAEARTIGGLDHPNVIALHELASDPDGRLFYSMKRIDGTAWSEVLEERSLADNLTVLLRVSDAIRYAHSRGIIHRDIKPANVMLGRYGEVLVADWGLALPHPIAGIDDPNSNNSIGGTPAYMAPEQAIGSLGDVGPKTDVYLLGATLFQLLAGFPPHEGETLVECIRNAADNRFRVTTVQSELMDVAMTAMAANPNDRYRDVESFQLAIRDYQQHQESIGLVRRAADHAAEAKRSQNYERFNLAMSLIRESLELWPENRRAKSTLRQLRIDYAALAAEQDDLDLALSLLEAAGEEQSEMAAAVRCRRERRTDQIRREVRYSTLFAQSPDGVLVTRMSDGTTLEANDAFLRMFGYERAAILGSRVADYHLWVSPERREDFVRQVRETGRVDNFETVLRDSQERPIPVLISARRTELDGESLVVAHTRDITARKQAEDALRRSRQRLREIQKLANLGTWEFDIAARTIRWSEETYRIAGMKPDGAPRTLDQYLAQIHPDDRERTANAIREALENAAAYQLQIRHLRPDGSYATTITRGQPIRDATGRVVELYGTVLDISDRKSKEDGLRQHSRRLQAMLDWVDRPLIALDRDGTLLAAARCVRTALGRDHLCMGGDCRLEIHGDLDLRALSAATEVSGQFTSGGHAVGPLVRLRLEPADDFLRGELLSPS